MGFNAFDTPVGGDQIPSSTHVIAAAAHITGKGCQDKLTFQKLQLLMYIIIYLSCFFFNVTITDRVFV